MRLQDLVALLAAFEEVGLRYLIVGGYAVIAHGHVRSTLDLDLVVDFHGDQPARLVQVLTVQGYRPRAPVALGDFAKADIRREWIEQKQAQVFTVVRGDGIAHCEVDIFLQEPFAFDPAFQDALVSTLPGGTTMRIVDLGRLKTMKRQAGRPQDQADLIALDKLGPR